MDLLDSIEALPASQQQGEDLVDLSMLQCSAGSSHSLALSRSGTIFAFGSNQCGQLGVGLQSSVPLPMPIPSMTHGVPLFVVGVGDHSVAVCQSRPSSSLTLAGNSILNLGAHFPEKKYLVCQQLGY